MRSRTADWFLCKIRYEKVMEDGLQKKVTEQYVVDALSFTEAEARIIEEMSSYISGQFDIVEIDRCVWKEVFFMSTGAKKFINEVEDFKNALRKGDHKEADKVFHRPLEEQTNIDTRWYKAKVTFITIDEKTEKEKRSPVYYLVEGCSLASARENIDQVMTGTMIDYDVVGVNETKIVDVFEYTANKADK